MGTQASSTSSSPAAEVAGVTPLRLVCTEVDAALVGDLRRALRDQLKITCFATAEQLLAHLRSGAATAVVLAAADERTRRPFWRAVRGLAPNAVRVAVAPRILLGCRQVEAEYLVPQRGRRKPLCALLDEAVALHAAVAAAPVQPVLVDADCHVLSQRSQWRERPASCSSGARREREARAATILPEPKERSLLWGHDRARLGLVLGRRPAVELGVGLVVVGPESGCHLLGSGQAVGGERAGFLHAGREVLVRNLGPSSLDSSRGALPPRASCRLAPDEWVEVRGDRVQVQAIPDYIHPRSRQERAGSRWAAVFASSTQCLRVHRPDAALRIAEPSLVGLLRHAASGGLVCYRDATAALELWHGVESATDPNFWRHVVRALVAVRRGAGPGDSRAGDALGRGRHRVTSKAG